MDLVISTRQHLAHTDGSRTLVLALDALPDDPAEVLRGVGGTIVDHGDEGVTITWIWAPGMVPLDPVSVCSLHIEDALIAWAMRWAKVDALDLT